MKRNIIVILLMLMGISLIYFGVTGLVEKDNVSLTKVTHPKSYKELYNLIKSKTPFYYGVNVSEDAVNLDKSSNDYSNTNVQVLGVDEADIVKTDGDYIYTIKGQYIYIVKADNGDMSLVSKITAEGTNTNYVEMYVNNNKLIVIKNEYSNIYTYDGIAEDACINCGTYIPEYNWNRGETTIEIYDITDKKNPTKESELSQSGYYLSSRMVNNYVYVLTNYYVYSDIVLNEEESYVPSITTNETKPIAIDDILIAPNPTSSSYLTVTGIDVKNNKDFASSNAILGSSSNIYADTDNIYIAGYTGETINNTYRSKTSLIKLSMTDGVIDLESTGVVNGTILNQFSMDESDGYFRIVTTTDEYTYYDGKDDAISSTDTNTSKNNLYVLDSNLKVVSKLEGLAKGERIYSVRFDGDIAYFVTFKQVDPLFVVDLSDAKDPIIKSELKITGFSEYLHVYNDKYLFGLGKSANEEGRVTGLKISMFNISDKTDVKESYKTSVGDEYSWTESSYNHKSILVSNTKGLIAFPVNDYYVIYKFEDKEGFTKVGQIKFDFSDGLYYYYGNIRGLYINDYLYAINQNEIKTLNLETYKTGDTLELK